MKSSTAEIHFMDNIIAKWNQIIFRVGLFVGFLILSLPIACSKSNPAQPTADPIWPSITYQLDIPEPSGVCFGKNYETLWIVSDAPHNKVYQTDLQGRILRILDFKGDDLEGITYDHTDDVLWLAEEQLQEIIKISTGSLELERFRVPVEKFGPNGLEGVTLARPFGFWVTNEKNPVVLARLDSLGNRVYIYNVALAEDYSDVCSDPTRNILWIVSDESRLLIAWSPESGVAERYRLPFEKAEGVALTRIHDRFLS